AVGRAGARSGRWGVEDRRLRPAGDEGAGGRGVGGQRGTPMKKLAVSLVLGVTALTVAVAPFARGQTAFVVHKVSEAHLAGAPPSVPFFVLVVGSDARPGQSG